MARYRLILAAVFAFAALTFAGMACGRADAATCTIPNTFSNGTTINAAPFNQNFTAFQTCASYVPAVYNTSGSLLNNTVHSSFGTCSIVASYFCYTNFSGASAFTSASTYACAFDLYSGTINAGALSYAANSTGNQVSIIEAGAGSMTVYFTVLCTGY